MEVINLDPAVHKYLRNMQATSSPPVLPQLCLEIMVNPPSPGDPSYETHTEVRAKSVKSAVNPTSGLFSTADREDMIANSC